MASQTAFSVKQGNDVLVDLDVLEDDEVTPQDLTGLTPQMLIKGYQDAPDTSATVITLSSGLTITSVPAGTLTALLPRALLAVAGSCWFRLDVTDLSGNLTTAICGSIIIQAV
jgi:hypothetical protein